VLPEPAPPLNVRAAAALFDRLFHGRRRARIQDLVDDSCRAGTDTRDSRQGAAGPGQIRQRHVEREDRDSGPLVAEHLLL
jgi:hypothetical protein